MKVGSIVRFRYPDNDTPGMVVEEYIGDKIVTVMWSDLGDFSNEFINDLEVISESR